MKRVLLCLCLLGIAVSQGPSYDYADALGKSILFYEAQRSGPLPDDNRIDFRYDSALDDYILGGYYDAGDHVKMHFPAAAMNLVLLWGALTWPGGYAKAGQTEWMDRTVRWGVDYLVACHTEQEVLYAQIGDGDADHSYWGRPEEMTMPRPAMFVDAQNPGSDLAADYASALAAASMYYEMSGDAAKAEEALSHARELYDFAFNFRGLYTDSLPIGGYVSSSDHDEMVLAALWMYKATGEIAYLDQAESWYEEYGLSNFYNIMGWDNKVPAVQVLMWEQTGDDKYLVDVDNYVSWIINDSTYTPLGLAYFGEWGSLRSSGNQAHIMMQIATLGHRTDEIESWAEGQINYILGDTGISYMIGFGEQGWPLFEHHRAASCFDQPSTCDWNNHEMPDPNPQLLVGAVVGGPDANDFHNDSRFDYQHNEVAIDYNAGIQSAIAALVDKYF